MKILKQILKEAESKKVAIGHFNITELSMLKAIFEAAKELGVPVIIGTSEGEAGFLGRGQAVTLIKSLRKEYDFPIFLNSDHTHSFEEVKKAVAAGYDAILFDGGTLSLEENIRQTKEVVDYVKSVSPQIIIEGELGNIGSGSVIRKELPPGAAIRPEDLTKPEDALRFVKKTGVDMLAPAVGNLHGMLVPSLKKRPLSSTAVSRESTASLSAGFAGGYDYPLDIDHIRAIKKAVKIPLVLHGGSGNTDADFLAAIKAGISIIHISTELRAAWREGLERGLKNNPEEIAPYKILADPVAEVKKIVASRLKLFNNL